MLGRVTVLIIACCGPGACAPDRSASADGPGEARNSAVMAAPEGEVRASATEPLVIGDSFTIDSRIMGESRRINVFVPSVYGEKPDAPMPVLYMPDGGMNEDFVHIAGLVQVLVSNGGMRPFMLVGIQNTQRRRDLTGPTSSEEDLKIAPIVGGAATFRRFIRDELMPTVRARYRTTEETAIVGESVAGLFVVETFFLEPDLFTSYVAVDPSLWWNNEELLKSAGDRLKSAPAHRKSVFVAGSSDAVDLTGRLAAAFDSHRTGAVDFRHAPMPTETHATIYHPAALVAFRIVFAPAPGAK